MSIVKKELLRYFVEIAYNGKHYFGWQRQPNQMSVQQVVEEALSLILRSEIKVVAAGRTDTGVHAMQLFAHFDCEEIEVNERLIFRINSFLPQDISIKNILRVTDDAHARFDAVQREYEYRISLGKNPFNFDLTYQLYNKPNIEAMNQAAKLLLVHTDFQCFSRSKTDVKTYICKIVKAQWEERDDILVFTVIADRFLRNMVRAIVGTLLDIGFGKTTLSEFQEILNSQDRSEAGASAPAHGLYLRRVVYPESLFL
ncbi:tRNA pseudouridine(38-40) synthase TruA [Aequorivita sp. H23M31]|uniref:tRNA pseudouridine synthase A n=1 Tax=Aequorivita ciconiae TaxID=2494375 RepID=A0A451FSD4_9FLAO|nr:tRNA pseudouridine(38-40) synthase TruA [Aequorivita sp. H23M31]QAA80310.1 tRNA pseudouridine(38-40) synthase TruA [Aequorivita sp. H23M31]